MEGLGGEDGDSGVDPVLLSTVHYSFESTIMIELKKEYWVKLKKNTTSDGNS